MLYHIGLEKIDQTFLGQAETRTCILLDLGQVETPTMKLEAT
jgi:hypothetical protein